MISIVTVNWQAYEFLQILIESIQLFSSYPYELIVIDNSIEKKDMSRHNVKWIPQEENIGHGQGLNEGSKHVIYPYVMFLDVDVHLLKRGWEESFLKLMAENDVVAAEGVPEKPIRPACMMMKKGIATKYDWAPTQGYKGHRVTPDGFDVAISAYYQMLKDNLKISFMNSYPNRYGTLTGEEWGFDEPFVYHHWHGSHLTERQIDFESDLETEKLKLFSKIPWRLP